jgi:hypothetical protein
VLEDACLSDSLVGAHARVTGVTASLRVTDHSVVEGR